MKKKAAENNYIKFLLGKVEASLPSVSIENDNSIMILGLIERLRNSDDLSKEIFILSKVNGLKILAEYLAFVLKKVRNKKIRYENFLLNLEEDSKFILSQLNSLPDNFSEASSVISKTEKPGISNFSGSKFKVEEIVNELVDEEFQELAKIDEISKNMESNYKEISNDRAEIPEDYFIEQEIEEAEIKQSKPKSGKDSNLKPEEHRPSSTENKNIQINKKLIEFENKLFNLNQSLRKDLSMLIDKCLLEATGDEESSNLRDKIISSTGELSDEAETLSFQLISKIYRIINEYFVTNGSDINPDKIETLKNGLDAVESLINGEDFLKYDDLIKNLESINKTEEVTEPTPPPVPKELRPEDKTSNRLRHNILELENIFKRLDDIKGEYKNYEGLRFLSTTLNIFKDVIEISKEMHKPKLAQTAEGSYVFIRFLQNYRMDPFDDLSKQIYGYIVYNLKLIYLDKPTKDLDTFISYLNDPVKIFTETKNLKDNE